MTANDNAPVRYRVSITLREKERALIYVRDYRVFVSAQTGYFGPDLANQLSFIYIIQILTILRTLLKFLWLFLCSVAQFRRSPFFTFH